MKDPDAMLREVAIIVILFWGAILTLAAWGLL